MPKKKQSIFRVSIEEREEVGYTSISKHISPDRLTMQELGLMYYLLSKHNDWTVIPKAIARTFKLDIKTVYRYIDVLERKGHIRKSRVSGRVEYEVYENLFRLDLMYSKSNISQTQYIPNILITNRSLIKNRVLVQAFTLFERYIKGY